MTNSPRTANAPRAGTAHRVTQPKSGNPLARGCFRRSVTSLASIRTPNSLSNAKRPTRPPPIDGHAAIRNAPDGTRPAERR
jgi:hypothetical protein